MIEVPYLIAMLWTLGAIVLGMGLGMIHAADDFRKTFLRGDGLSCADRKGESGG